MHADLVPMPKRRHLAIVFVRVAPLSAIEMKKAGANCWPIGWHTVSYNMEHYQ